MPGPQELMVIGIVALLVFGPDRLPELARTAARTLVRIRNEAGRNVRELREAAEIRELERDVREVGRDLRGTRDAVTRSARDLLREPSATGGGVRDEHRPPPTDPEAT